MNGRKKPEQLISLATLARKLERTTRTALRWRQMYNLPYYMIGNTALYDWDEWIDALRVRRGCKPGVQCTLNCKTCRSA